MLIVLNLPILSSFHHFVFGCLDDEVVMDEQGPVSLINKNAGPARGFAHIRLDWDEVLHDTVGDSTCMNGGSGITQDCPAIGHVRHLGTRFNSANDPEGGLPITAQPEIVGLAGGFGWLLSLDGGAPHTLKISQIEVMPNTPLLLSIAYPPETTFTIEAKAASWCLESCTRSCTEKFTPVDTVQEVRYSDGNVYHFDKSTGLLTIRVIMFPHYQTGEPDWKLYNFDDVDSDGNFELRRFERDGILLPMKAWKANIEIGADCARNGVYCATAPPVTSDYDDICDPGFTQKSYDRCCDASNNCQDMGLLVPTSAPTVTPAPTTRNPEFCTNDPTFQANNIPKRNCTWIAEKPATRCLLDSGAELGCPATCNPGCLGCEDDPDYFEVGKPKRTCEWVAKRAEDRCENEENDDACQATCNPICATKCTDNPYFLVGGNVKRTCGWVNNADAEKREKRCGLNNNEALFGCPATCNEDCA
jgi:hypothetical protein